ncbi:MAG: DUF4209 domain-containing protein [Planctomycetes bacterium]|nr:DUF4209 domain-containing protein [Planctomycetota bacterium]
MTEGAPIANGDSNLSGAQKGLPVQPPPELVAVLEALDSRPTAFDSHEVERELGRAVPNRQSLAPALRRGAWAEQVAFAFSTHGVAGGGPWGTYFQPLMSGTTSEGSAYYSPDIAEVEPDVLAYWAMRARAARHPVLVARYADLVWDMTHVVTKSKRGRGAIEFARLAVDAYIAASRMDNGAARYEMRQSLGRALRLAMSVDDSTRIAAATAASIEYVERTAEDDRIGTYCYLFDNLLPPEKGPHLEPEQERTVIALFESKLAVMTTPGSEWDADPHSPRDIGMRLAAYYERRGMPSDRARVIHLVAGAFERRAKLGDALMGVIFLNDAREHYLLAGARDEADRVQLEAQKLGPEAEKRMARSTVSREISKEDVEKFLDAMVEGGFEAALVRLARRNVPDQGEVARRAEETAREHPIYAIFAAQPVKLDHGHIEADVGDSAGDPDGLMVHRTAEALQFDVPWISWTIDRLVRDGLTTEHVVAFVEKCPFFVADRMELIRRGIQAHLMGDYAQAIHLLIPQIEHAIVGLSPHGGKPSTKPHRTGRGVMQFKNLNDMLPKDAWPVPGDAGENLRMYLLSVLTHPKGLNIRNDVCHGLWATNRFGRQASERVLHVLLTLSLLRATPREKGVGDARSGGAVEPASDPDHH